MASRTPNQPPEPPNWPIVFDVDDGNYPRGLYTLVLNDPPGVCIAWIVASKDYMASEVFVKDASGIYSKYLQDLIEHDPSWFHARVPHN